MLLMLAGMITVGLAGLLEVAAEALAGVTVIGAAQAPRDGAMMCRLAVAGLEVGAEAGAGAGAGTRAGTGAGAGARVTLGIVVLAAAGVVALALDAGLKEELALGLHVLTLPTQWRRKAHLLTLQMTTGAAVSTLQMTIRRRMGRWERLIWIGRPVRRSRMTSLLHIVLCIMAKEAGGQ